VSDALSRIGPSALTNSAATIFTSTGQTTLRSIRVCNETGTARTFDLSIGTAGAGKYLFKGVTVAANDSFGDDLNITLADTEILQALASVNSALTITIGTVVTT